MLSNRCVFSNTTAIAYYEDYRLSLAAYQRPRYLHTMVYLHLSFTENEHILFTAKRATTHNTQAQV